jgi:hypothetical protein
MEAALTRRSLNRHGVRRRVSVVLVRSRGAIDTSTQGRHSLFR